MKISELHAFFEETWADHGNLEVVIVDADSGYSLALDKDKIKVTDERLEICPDYDDVID